MSQKRKDIGLDEAIGARVRQIRLKRGVKQVDIGRLLNRESPSTSAHKIEKGLVGLTLVDLKTIADHLDISLDWLVRGTDPKGIDSALNESELERVLDQLGATADERAVFAAHRHLYAQQRITAAYAMAFLLGRRSGATVEGAVDQAVTAQAREAAIAETGSAKRAKPDALRRRRKKPAHS
jgi:transcriptional regulator with XRE-family HTH domain